MSLINFKEIDFNKSIDKTNKTINFNGSEIQIVNYLSANDKYDLIMITLQKAFDNGIYNDFKLQMYFDLHLVFMYTNLIFDAEDRVDSEGLYNTLKQSGFIDIVKENIDEKEELWNYIKMIENKIVNKQNNLIGLISGLIEELPNKVNEAKEKLAEMDPEFVKTLTTGSFAGMLGSFLGKEETKDIK